jgi:hypothetical protein
VRPAVGVEQDVGRLEVVVEDAALVGVVDGPGHGGQQRRGGARVGGEAAEVLGEVAALDQLHAEVESTLPWRRGSSWSRASSPR